MARSFPTRLTRRGIIGLGATALLSPLPALAATQQATLETATASILVDARWVSDHADDLVIVAFAPVPEFSSTHIAGAVQIDWPDLEVSDTSDASLTSWRDRICRLIGDLGITPERTVVAYDHGTLFAARLWWVLRYLGHSGVHVLDGGLSAWLDAGEVTESGDPPRADRNATTYPATPVDALLATKNECLSLLDDPNTAFIDARSVEEYAAGHIPGAINIPYTANARMESPPIWLPPGELTALYVASGITPEQRVIPYCSSGVRSAVTAMTLALIGYPDVSLYTGSWNEWGADQDTPKVPAAGQPASGLRTRRR